MIQFQSLTKTLLFPLILSSLVLYLKAQRESDTTDTVTSIQIDATGAVKNPDSQNHPPKPFQCNLYLAPSSIPGAGFGVFTTRDIKQNELILDYLDSPSVVVTDMASHTQNTENDYWTHIDYFWSGDGPAEFEAEDVSENVFMLGSLSNYHTYLRNVKPYPAKYDDTYLDRFKDPGAGAFSYHEGQYFYASRDITAGEEIFADYSEEWLDSRPNTFADIVPRVDDFKKATSIVQKIKKNAPSSDFDDDKLSLLVDVVDVLSDRVANAMPKSKKNLDEILKSEKVDKTLALKTTEERSVDWIRENGFCLENIRSGKSTIKQAGRGAFAQTVLKQGSIIAAVPLNTIADSDKLFMYELTKDEGTGELTRNNIYAGEQMMMNYCFGHPNSPPLFCPMTNVVLINHCSDRKVGEGQCGDNGPNAKIQWATDWDSKTQEWLKKSLDEIVELTKTTERGLSFEVVALRDIMPGDEIFIDYGENWEKAWEEHVKNWVPPIKDDYQSVRSMIDGGVLRTVDELKENPYPSNVQQVCFFQHCDDDDEEDGDDEEEETVYFYNEIEADFGVEAEKSLYPCEIKDKPSPNLFSVTVFCPDNNPVKVKEYPSNLISFRTKKYRSDQHLPGAFRHYIEIDHGIFPDHWFLKEN